MLIGSIGHRSAALIEKSTCFVSCFSDCTACTGKSPVALLYSCISCNLLLLIKQYVEVHVEIRGSSQKRTGKSEALYVEVHNEKPGSSLWFLDIRNATVDERTGRFNWETDRLCTGKFAYIRKAERIVVGEAAIVILWRNRSYGKVHKEPYWQHGPYGEIFRTASFVTELLYRKEHRVSCQRRQTLYGKVHRSRWGSLAGRTGRFTELSIPAFARCTGKFTSLFLSETRGGLHEVQRN